MTTARRKPSTARVRVRPYRTLYREGVEHVAGSSLELPADEAAALIDQEIVDPDVKIAEPLPGYDQLDVDEIIEHLMQTPSGRERRALRERVQAYERRRETPRRQILALGQNERAKPHRSPAARITDIENAERPSV